MATSGGFLLTDGDDERAVHCESSHRGPTRRCKAKNANAIPLEMSSPTFSAWVKQWHLFASLGIQCLPARAFAQRARDAGEGEVVQCRGAPGGHGNDVVHVEEGFLSRLRQPAILAAILRPLDDLAAGVGRDSHALRRGGCSTSLPGAAVTTIGLPNPPGLQPHASPRG